MGGTQPGGLRMTEIALRQPAEVAVAEAAEIDVDSWASVVGEISRLADVICGTSFVPKAYRNDAPAVMAAILAGRELGLPPMTSLRHVQVVEGSPGLSAEYKRARVLSAGHRLDVNEHTTEACQITGHRKGHQPVTVRFTIADARKAGIYKARGAWETRPRRMLFARACTEVCDALFADITNGLPTAELLEESDGASGYDEQPAEAARPAGRVTAAEITARRSAPQNASPAETTPSTPPAEPAGEAPAPPPGEDEPSAQPDDTDYDTPGTRTDAQVGKLQTVYHAQMGFTRAERDDMLTASEEIIRRGLLGPHDGRTHSNLSFNEAKLLIDTLERCGTRANLVALLASGEVPGDG
jgi:hypothetical protein